MTPPNRVGIITASTDLILLSHCKSSHMDFIVLDAEATGLSVQACASVVANFSDHATEVAIRVPNLTPETLLSFANTGADELVLPHVRSLDELLTAFSATRYPPSGVRSLQASAASGYGRNYEKVPKLTILVETVQAVHLARKIAQSGLVSGAFIGQTDLANDFLQEGITDSAVLEDALSSTIHEFRGAELSVGLPMSEPHDADRVFAKGATRAALYWEKFVGDVIHGMVN